MTVLSYFLAVDVGTSRTAASTARLAPDGSLLTAAFPLGRNSDSAPSAVFAADGELLFGESAERRGLAQPEHLVREFKRRVGDDVPIRAGSERFAAEDLYAHMVAWVVDAVAEREGARPTAIAVTIPVTWGGHRSGLVAAALSRRIPGDIRLISEPEAAARHYESSSPLEPGRTLAVYDLGGGTFDAVVLRKDELGDVRMVGDPVGIGDFGGADFDDVVLRRVVAAAGLSPTELAADSAARVALSTLRRECVEAKEALSFDSEAVVPVLVGASPTTVRLTRSEFEELIEDGIERTVEALAQALETAGVPEGELDAILLTGGSSRIPRIAELLSERFDRPIAIDADPKAIVALGAARALADPHAMRAATAAAAAAAAALSPVGDALAISSSADAALAPPARPEFGGPASVSAKRRWFERLPATAAMATGALVLATGIVLASATGLGSSPVADEEVESPSLAAWLGVTLFDSSPAAAADDTEPVAAVAPAPPAASPPPPPESIRRADYSPPRSTPRASNPRTESMRKAVAASPAPQAPSSAAGGGSGQSGTGTSAPPADTSGPVSDPVPTPTETEAPAPEETQAPAPTETQTPTPTETQSPAPEETQAPAPEETQPPAPEETPPTAPPEETPAPTPDPEPEPPAPDPSPSPTEPV